MAASCTTPLAFKSCNHSWFVRVWDIRKSLYQEHHEQKLVSDSPIQKGWQFVSAIFIPHRTMLPPNDDVLPIWQHFIRSTILWTLPPPSYGHLLQIRHQDFG